MKNRTAPRRPPKVKLGPRPCRDMGQAARRAREAAGRTQLSIADQVGTRREQVSLLESGAGVGAQYYALVAAALEYRGPLEMLQGHDPLTRRLLRLWHGMDEHTRELAYKKLRVWLIED